MRSKSWDTALSNLYQKTITSVKRELIHLCLKVEIYLSLPKVIICPLCGDYNHKDTTLVCSHCKRGDVILFLFIMCHTQFQTNLVAPFFLQFEIILVNRSLNVVSYSKLVEPFRVCQG